MLKQIFILTAILFFSSVVCAMQYFSEQIPEERFESHADFFEYTNNCIIRNEKYQLSDEEILVCYHKIYDGAQQFGIDSLVWLYAYHLGHRYRRLNRLSKAYYFQNIAYVNSHLIKDKELVGRIKNVYGLIHKDVGEPTKALEYFLESIEDFNQSKSTSLVAKPLSNISSLYKKMGDYKNAIKYKKKSILLSKEMTGEDYVYSYTGSCVSLAATYCLLEQQDSVTFYLNEAMPLIEKLNKKKLKNRKLIFYAYKTAAKNRIKIHDFKMARVYIAQAKQFVFNKRGRKAAIKILKANYALERSNKKELFEILQDLENVKGKTTRIEVLKLKIKSQEKYKMFKEMTDSYKLLIENKEKLIQQENHNYILFNTAKFEAFEKQEEINELKKQQKLAQLTIEKHNAFNLASIALLIGLSIGVFSIFYLFRQKSKHAVQLINEVNVKTLDLQKLNESLEHKNKELQRFNYILSHDLKEPIRSIVGFSTMLQKGVDDKEKAASYFKFIINSGRQLNTLINDINEFQRIDQLDFNPEKVKLDRVIERVKKDLATDIQEANAIIEYDEFPDILNSSKIGITQMLTCIIGNGIHFNESKQPKICITCEENSHSYFINISDNGIGIPREYFEQIFVMFKRLNTRDKYPGSGIGLALCQKVANRIGAKINILESSPQKGTAFQIAIRKDFQFDLEQNKKPEVLESV